MAGEQYDYQESRWKKRISEAKQVLVEGLDEVRVLDNFASRLGLADVQCHAYQGKQNLRNFLKTFTALSDFTRVRSLAVVADADFSTDGTRDRIRGALQNVGLPQPSAPLTEVLDGNLKVSYLILPHWRGTGMLGVCPRNNVLNDMRHWWSVKMLITPLQSPECCKQVIVWRFSSPGTNTRTGS